jgi:regulator of RNase E activity RraB
METEKEKKKREKHDLNTIKALQKNGADMAKEHIAEHHFTVRKKDDIETIAAALEKEGYAVTEAFDAVDNNDGSTFFFFDAQKSCVIEPEGMFKQSKRMAEIAASYGAAYNGWDAGEE